MRIKLYYNIRKQGYTQRAFAELVGVTEAWLSTVVNGRRNPSKYLTMRMAEELGISEEDVLHNDPMSMTEMIGNKINSMQAV